MHDIPLNMSTLHVSVFFMYPYHSNFLNVYGNSRSTTFICTAVMLDLD